MLKRYLGLAFFSVLFVALIAQWAAAETVVIGAGKPGRNYDSWAQSIAEAYRSRKFEASVVNLKGSDDITLNLCSGDLSFAPAQQDAAFQRSMEDCDLVELWTYPSEEYMFLMVPPGSSVDELEDLTSASQVVTDAGGSGSDFTLRSIKRIEQSEQYGNKSDWSQLQVVNKSLKSGLGLVSGGKAQAVFFVGSPTSADMAFFLKSKWVPIEVYDKNLDDLDYAGQPLYEGTKVNVPGYGKVYTYRVKTFIYGQELGEAQQETFESIMSTR